MICNHSATFICPPLMSETEQRQCHNALAILGSVESVVTTVSCGARRSSPWRREDGSLDFELTSVFLRQLAGGHGDLEHAVLECGLRLVGLHTFGKRKGAIERFV